MKIIVKPVQLRSREYDIVHFLSTTWPPHESLHTYVLLYIYKMNGDDHHVVSAVLNTIPVLDDEIGLFVMEEWSLDHRSTMLSETLPWSFTTVCGCRTFNSSCHTELVVSYAFFNSTLFLCMTTISPILIFLCTIF
jgi:hypothetical protein